MPALTPRAATTLVFASHGAVIGTWFANIPWVQERFGLSTSAMGLILLGLSSAVILVLPFAGQAVARYGSRRMAVWGGLVSALALNLPMVAPAAVLVPAGLLVLGASGALQDVGMNSHGVHVERHLGRPIMSSLHAGWSFGGMAGSAGAALVATAGVDPRAGAAVASVLLAVLVVAAGRRMGEGAAGEGRDAPRFALPGRGVGLLALVCFLVMLSEGAMADWGGVYLRQDLGSAAGVAALAFAAVTAGMTAGRLVGDRLNSALGPVRMLRLGALLTAVPLTALLVAGAPAAALAGFVVVGFGLANGVPLVFSAAGRLPGSSAGPGIAAVSSMGSVGFLAGPPVIGFLGDAISLPWALGLLVLAAIAVAGLARRAVGPAGAEPARAPAEALT